MIVIDPAHGGTDDGAQGPNGTLEKDLVLRYARQLRAEFERLGYRAVMTRNDDSNPSYEDRAATANAYRDAIFITIHVSSTGKIGTARAYSYQFSNETASAPGQAPKSLVAWEEAQRPYLDASHRLADILQTELAQRFPGSPTASTAFAIRELRSVSAPAVAVELSSVAVPDGSLLASMGAPLAGTIAHSVQLSRPGYCTRQRALCRAASRGVQLMPRNLQITLAILAVAVIIGLLSLRGLQNRMARLAQAQTTEEQARRELLKPQLTSSSDVLSQTKIFWAAGPDHIEPSQVALPLSADPAKRARQVIDALILQTPSPDQRTLPADATLLGFYILPDGTAVADFSDALSTGTPSGIISEMQAIDSIARTLENNVSGLRRLKILIHGQEADTLAGHVDLTGFFELNSAPSGAPAVPALPGTPSPLPPSSNSTAAPASPLHR